MSVGHGFEAAGRTPVHSAGFSVPCLLLLLAACGGDSNGPPPPPPAATGLAFVTAPAATVQAFTTLSPAPVVELRDASGHPVKKSGVAVAAALQGGTAGGTASVNTDASGRATFSALTVSGVAGQHALSFTSTGLTTLQHSLTVTAGIAAKLVTKSAVAQSTLAGSAVAEAPSVLVTDNADNPVVGAVVTFAVTAGGGTVAGATQTSSAAGLAAATSWTLGGDPGANTLNASLASGGTPAVFTATALATMVLTKQSDNMTGEVNHAASLSPSVMVGDSHGAPIAGVTVTFAAQNGGSIAAAVGTSDGAGIAMSGQWTLGTGAGAQAATASATGAEPVLFQARASPGPASALAIVSGNNQSAVIWHTLTGNPTVAVRDQFGNGVSQGTMNFQVTGGGGGVATASVPVSGGGTATTSWTLGRSPGPNRLSATLAASAIPPAVLSATATDPTSPYDIEVRYLGTATPAQQAAVAEAVLRWRVIITSELPDVQLNLAAGACDPSLHLPAINEVVDDILIYVQITDIDGVNGVLGGGGPCVVRNVGTFPAMGFIQLDAADLDAMDQGTLNDLLTHEVGHVLGFGTIWADKGLLEGADTLSDDPRFTGTSAIVGYHALGGQQPTVPVENTGGPGTEDAHWRESIFHSELMTGFLDSGGDPLTGMTIGSMADLGYQVDYASAEPLGFAVSMARRAVPLTSQFREQTYTSPIIVVDPAGNITGHRPRR